MILKRKLIPTQDDPENRSWLGFLRPVANTHAERRSADEGTDSGVPKRQPGNHIQRGKPRRTLPLGGAGFGGARICRARQEAARRDSSLHREDDRIEPAAGDPVDPPISDRGSSRSGPLPAPTLCGKVHQQRHRAASRGGLCTRLAERAGYATDTEAGAGVVRQGRVCAFGGGVGGASVQLAPQRALPEGGGEMGANATQRDHHRRAAPARSAGKAWFSAHRHSASRRLGRSQGGCTTSMPWIR
jgi:hypothetical protein